MFFTLFFVSCLGDTSLHPQLLVVIGVLGLFVLACFCFAQDCPKGGAVSLELMLQEPYHNCARAFCVMVMLATTTKLGLCSDGG